MTTLYRTHAVNDPEQGLWATSKEASAEAAARREQGKSTIISKVTPPKMPKKQLMIFMFEANFDSCSEVVREVKGKTRGIKPLPPTPSV